MQKKDLRANARLYIAAAIGVAEEAAKKAFGCKERTSGAEAPTYCERLNGTSELVPSPIFTNLVLSSAACEDLPLRVRHMDD